MYGCVLVNIRFDRFSRRLVSRDVRKCPSLSRVSFFFPSYNWMTTNSVLKYALQVDKMSHRPSSSPDCKPHVSKHSPPRVVCCLARKISFGMRNLDAWNVACLFLHIGILIRSEFRKRFSDRSECVWGSPVISECSPGENMWINKKKSSSEKKKRV